MILLLLSGCGTARYDTKESTKILLPQIVEYSRSLQDNAATEIESGQCKALAEFAKDYVQMRDRVRFVRNKIN